ncbi:MAG: hypothetical protein EBU90_26790 [Proteobacteria bacterium]|nr:hypothetical protein [Pseudomonadota bacterium]
MGAVRRLSGHQKMKKLLLCLVAFAGCGYVEPGHVGVKVNLYGQDKGIDDVVIPPGRIWFNPWTTVIYEFPVYEQNVVWSGEESIQFNDRNGAPIQADVAIQYSFEQDYLPKMFQKLRKDADSISHGFLRTQVRDKINRQSESLDVTSIFGAERSKLLDRAKESINHELSKEYGINVHTLAIVGKLVVDPQVEHSINAVITATQRALEAENKVKQIEAEASPELLQYKAMERWDGKLPQAVGGTAVPFIKIQDAQ